MKHIPTIGERLYTYTPCSDHWVSDVRNPWTVESVNKTNTVCVIRAANPVFNGPCYYNSLPDYIEDDPNGKRIKMRWNEKRQRWQESPASSYPRVAVFGSWDYYPYLN